MNCESLGIPNYLIKNERLATNVFEKDEKLFRRFNTDRPITEWQDSSNLSASVFPIRNDSYNRSKFCQTPEDVLYNTRIEDNGVHYFQMGILEIGIIALKKFEFTINQNNQLRKFILKPVHKPEICMYPHSEIHVFENGNFINENKPKSTKASIRDFLIVNTTVIKIPDPK